jgi:heme exporter protein A
LLRLIGDLNGGGGRLWRFCPQGFMAEKMTSSHRPHAELHSALALRVEGLCVERGERRVVEDIGFVLTGGETLKVTGPNGAGKSTLLRALAGLLPRSAGAVALEGAGEEEVALQTHYLAHADGLKAQLTVTENLAFWADYLAPAGSAQDFSARGLSVAAALAGVGLAHVAGAPVAILSAGQKRRVALARLMVAFRPLWLLDEPLTGLDAASREKFAHAMREHCALGGMIVAATHEPLGLDETRELQLGKRPTGVAS